MSGIYLLVLIAIWVFVARGIILFSKSRIIHKKYLRVAVAALLLSFWVGGAFWIVVGKKMYYDARVRELCTIDGGIKVFETVHLTTDLVDKFGGIRIPLKSKATSADLYFYELEIEYLRSEDPKINRSSYIIIRKSDNKILGESIHYGRGGGDMPGPWAASNYSCPPIKKNSVGIERQVFSKKVE